MLKAVEKPGNDNGRGPGVRCLRDGRAGQRVPSRDGLAAVPVDVARTCQARQALEEAFPDRGEEVEAAFRSGDVLDADGAAIDPRRRVVAGQRLYVFRPIPDEPAEPIRLDIIARNERWIAIDKPHGLASTPRGSHVAQTVTVAARRQFADPSITVAHRLDAATAGVMLLVADARFRGAYQELFARRRVAKWYLAIAPADDGFAGGRLVELALSKPRGSLQALVVDGRPNCATRIRLIRRSGGRGLYEIEPIGGRTHQIRAVMSHLGMPIEGDWLYPKVAARATADLQLLARRLEFRDPVDGASVSLESSRRLDWP
ncbi:MAG: pseudouridine synthase [Actinomycetaceae bacterium]|nr:pseudouridine synthase [Actinomycetaceae bacterium]